MPASATATAVPAPRVPEPAVDPAVEPAPEAAFGVRSTRWTDGGLEITGFARPGGRGTSWLSGLFTSLTLQQTDEAHTRTVRLRTRHLKLPEVTDDSGQSTFDYDWAGFTATVDPAKLRDGGRWLEGDWLIEAGVRAGRQREQGPLTQHWCGSGEYPLTRWVDRDVRVLPYFAENALRLRVEVVQDRITSVGPADGGLDLAVLAADCPEGTVLRLRHRQSDTELSFPLVPADGPGYRVRVPFAPFVIDGPGPHEMEHWDPELLRPDGSTARPVLDDRGGPLSAQHPLPAPGQLLYVKQLADGYPQFCVQRGTAFIERITASGDGFELAGEAPLPGDGPLELVLRHSNGTGEVHHPVARGERFSCRIPALYTCSDGSPRPLPKGIWELRIRPAGRADAEQPLIVAPQALATLPVTVTAGSPATGSKSVLLQRRWHDTLILDSTPVLAAAERSAYTQRRLLTEAYPAARRRPLREAVLYDVFGGRGYSDSPRAIHTELVRRGAPLEHLWVVDDAQGAVPEGVRPVRSHSAEWYEALATSRYLVGNTHFPDFIERRPGQLVVQTWHGSLLKRIAHDVENAWLGDAGYLAALDRESPQWSVLLSPSAFATPILRRAFRYEGEILESGYPRGDVLALGTGAGAVRERLGIPAGKRIVLYAPTWREDQQRESGDGFRLGLRLDLDAARAELGEDHVLLVRPHSHVREPLPGAGDGFLYDVGDYPDVQELLLAADVLVTDYSSIMFDFAITGRPILFFTYDLEHYRDTLRGFYFDLESEAPGPLIPTSPELLTALRDLAGSDALTTRYADAYRRFRAVHCHLDDGGAAARVVDRMLGGTPAAGVNPADR
ncbi:hypothetical protein GCM10009760_03370 [Kitasatospora kazusensis]|uniref:CDP-glycerol glycerophosphotransferase n=1 Tax=Kitasatospora kazusensis TaxID=407974 RepID=A0ABN2YR41_9ACTN